MGAIGPFWAKWGLGRVPRSASFFCAVNQTTFQQLRIPPNLVTRRISVSRHGIRKFFFQIFTFGVNLFQKSEIENRSNRHLTQNRLQVTGCTAERYCLLHVVVQRPRSFRGRSTFLYDVRLRTERQSCPIFGFWSIFPIQNP